MKTKIDHYQLVVNHRPDDQYEWLALLWLGSGVANAVIKSIVHYLTEASCIEDANKLLTELGIKKGYQPTMNKNSRQRKAATKGAHAPRKSTKPKVGASAAEITRRIAKERGS